MHSMESQPAESSKQMREMRIMRKKRETDTKPKDITRTKNDLDIEYKNTQLDTTKKKTQSTIEA